MILKQNTRDFKDLKAGQTFRLNGEIFMKVELEGDIECPRCKEKPFETDAKFYFAVNIVSGGMIAELSQTQVEVIECEVNEI